MMKSLRADPNGKLPSSGNSELEVLPRGITLSTLFVIVTVAAILHLGQDVFLPLAMAVLLTFALSPAVSLLRNQGLPPIAAVLATVLIAFSAIGLFLLLTAMQIGELVRGLPSYQANIVQKVNSFNEAGDGSGLISRISEMLTSINAEISSAVPSDGSAPAADVLGSTRPMPVEVIERQSVVQVLQALVLPLIRPIATAGLVVVVVIFMLLEREEIRDRFIRLLGARDLNRTTQMLEEAGGRVGTYLLIQLFVNVIYAIPIGVGLWVIGVPNAILWGLLTVVLRFVPFIGSFLAAIFPLFLAFAVSPGWSAVWWTAALFIVVELVTSNIIEPWLYGSRTGVSPLAIIVCAIFWTYIWGPLGLVLSTPLTVCLVVLGRHIPQFEVFDILFGDKPVLEPHARLYQRLLAGDPNESTFRAEEALEEVYLADYYQEIGIPALLLGQQDYQRGLMTAEQEDRFSQAANVLVSNLSAIVAAELQEAQASGKSVDVPQNEGELLSAEANAEQVGVRGRIALPGEGFKIVSIGGRTKLDDVAAAMLTQILAAAGAASTPLSFIDLTAARFSAVSSSDAQCIILNFLEPPSRASLLHIRRIKRIAPRVRVGVVIWEMPRRLIDPDGPRQYVDAAELARKTAEVEELGGDFAATSILDVLRFAFEDLPSKPIVETARVRKQPSLARSARLQ